MSRDRPTNSEWSSESETRQCFGVTILAGIGNVKVNIVKSMSNCNIPQLLNVDGVC